MKVTSEARGFTLALLALLISASGRAQGIVYVPLSQPINYGPAPTSQGIDITGFGSSDFTLICDGAFGSFINPGNNLLIVLPQTADLDKGSTIAALNLGDVMGPDPSSLNPAYEYRDSAAEPTGAPTLADQNTSGQIGNFCGKTAYIGFDLLRNGQNYYGWMEVENPYAVASGSIVSWAYESDPNTIIAAGATPEPSTYALMVVSGIGLYCFRKRQPKRY